MRPTITTLLLTLTLALLGVGKASGIEYEPLINYANAFMPSTNINVANEQFRLGASRLAWNVATPGDLSKDETCKEPIRLLFNGESIGEIPANSVDTDPYCVAFFGASLMDDDLLPEVRSVMVGFQFGFEEKIAPGKYTVEIPDGFFLVDGHPLPACKKDYSIAAQWYAEPADGAVDLEPAQANSFTIFYKSVRSIREGHRKTMWGDDFTKAKMTILFDGEDVTDHFDYAFVQKPVSVVFTAKQGMEITKGGTMKVTIDTGYFLTDDHDPITSVNYHFITKSDTTGIDSMTAVENDFQLEDVSAVYDLQGRLAASGSDAAEAIASRTLAPGIYIIRTLDGKCLKINLK